MSCDNGPWKIKSAKIYTIFDLILFDPKNWSGVGGGCDRRCGEGDEFRKRCYGLRGYCRYGEHWLTKPARVMLRRG